MTIKTRRQVLNSFDLPTTWNEKLKGMNPHDRVYITTEKPISEYSIEDLETFIEDKKTEAIILKAFAQMNEAVDILKSFGAEIDTEIIGIEKFDFLKGV